MTSSDTFPPTPLSAHPCDGLCVDTGHPPCRRYAAARPDMAYGGYAAGLNASHADQARGNRKYAPSSETVLRNNKIPPLHWVGKDGLRLDARSLRNYSYNDPTSTGHSRGAWSIFSKEDGDGGVSVAGHSIGPCTATSMQAAKTLSSLICM